MGEPKSDQAFPDCQAFLDKAVGHAKGWRIVFAERGDATNFRLRCYTTRRRLLKLYAKIHAGDGDYAEVAKTKTPWDGLVIFIKEAENGWAVIAAHDGASIISARTVEQGPLE